MIYVVAFDPIKFLTCWALKNDRQNLSFVKAINVVGEKRPEIPIKWPTPSFVIFIFISFKLCFETKMTKLGVGHFIRFLVINSFHKTEVLTVILKGPTCQNLNWIKSYNKNHNFQNLLLSSIL